MTTKQIGIETKRRIKSNQKHYHLATHKSVTTRKRKRKGTQRLIVQASVTDLTGETNNTIIISKKPTIPTALIIHQIEQENELQH